MKRLLLLAAMQSAILVGAQTRSDGHLFYEDFATKNNFSVNWTVTDANNDSKTWEYIDETLLRMQMAVQVWQSIYTKETMQQMII